jgi:Spy/CpxP family protein refolding chaperone
MSMKKSFLFLMGFVFLGSLMLAQPGQGPMGRQRLRESINRLRLLRMTEALELTEEQSSKIYPVYYRIEKEKLEIIKALNREIGDLKTFLSEAGPKEEKIAAKVKAVKDLKKNLLEKDQEFEDFLGENLTDMQKAKYIVFSVEFYRNLGEKLDRARGWPKEKRDY